MKELNPIAIINKYKVLIIALSLIAGAAFSIFLSQNQSYTATAIIEYTNSRASEGKAPDGTEIDTSEIYCAEVMKEVFQRMGLSYDDYNLDRFRSKIVVTPILSSEEQAVQEGKNERGEEYENEPTKYMISMTLNKEDAADPEVFARQVMDNMLDVFQRVYAENHVGSSTVVNDVVTLDESNYDYIEAIEAIETRVVDTLTSLSQYAMNNSTYRSVTTGYSFNDLYREFAMLESSDIPQIYSYILDNKITKNQDVLLAKYRQRIEDYDITKASSVREIADIKEIISAYVNMMRESGNTSITYEYILDQVYDSYYQDRTSGSDETVWMQPDETVEYDVLLENYIKNRSEYEYTLIEIAYCEYILETYGGLVTTPDTTEPVEGEEGAEAVVAAPAVAQPLVLTLDPAMAEQTEEMLDALMTKLDVLYERMSAVYAEYSEYAGAKNVGLISNIVVVENVKILLYSIIAVVAFALMISLATVLFGRMGEIFDYYMYMDHKLMIPNRNACDRYMKRYQRQLLRRDFSVLAIHVDDVRGKNDAYGRDECDAMMKKLVEIMEKVFPGEPESFMAVNGLGQFVVFLNGITEPQAKAYMDYIRDEALEYNTLTECPIEYTWGVAEAEKENIYRIHNLMIAAINQANSPAEAGVVR